MLTVSLGTTWNTDKGSVLTISKRATQFATFLGIKQKPPRMPALGSRELGVLELFWTAEQPALSALDVQDVMQQGQTQSPTNAISVNTLQSTLERLHRKELLHREKSGRAFIYRAACSKKDIIQRLLHDIAEDMTDGDMAPMISGFMEYVGSQDPALSSRLGEVLQGSTEQPDVVTKAKPIKHD